MSAYKLLENENFRESLDMMIKSYIDKQFREIEKPIPIPSCLTPLSYENKELQKAVTRLRKGGEIALYAHDVFIKKGESK